MNKNKIQPNVIIGAIQCKMCKTEHFYQMTVDQYNRYQDGIEHISSIFPDMDINEREMLISSICGSCFDRMFGEG